MVPATERRSAIGSFIRAGHHSEVTMRMPWASAIVTIVLLALPLAALAEERVCLPLVLDRTDGTVDYRVHGLNFSPYLDGQDPNDRPQISEAQIRERMGIIAPYTRWVRTFSSTGGMDKVGLVAHEMGLKAAVGAWLSDDAAANEAEIAGLIAAVQSGYVDAAVVGSEVLLRGDLTEAALLGYIARVRQAVPGIPVTTADTYAELLAHPAVVAAVDFVFANYYPYWVGVDSSYAIASLNVWHRQMVAAAGGKQVVVSETGWPSCGDSVGEAVPSPEAAAGQLLNFVSWARANRVDYFYFEAFDESWKARAEGPQGACWGIWDEDGAMKPGMQAVFDGETLADNWSGNAVVDGPGTPSIQFTLIPAYGSDANLAGRVSHIKPSEHQVAVYIKVGNWWWVKPYAATPSTDIMPDGTWHCDITTGDGDANAAAIVAYLLPLSFDAPVVLGAETLPAQLDANAVAKVEATRPP